MSYDGYPVRTTERDFFTYPVRLVGTGASVPTEVYGTDVAVSYIGVGQYRFTFPKNPYEFVGPTDPSRQATTPGDIKGLDFVFGAWTPATSTASAYVDLYVYDGGAAHDLAALEWISFDFRFQRA